MKIEIGESLLLSWLKHIKECQIVQTNWKASNKWELKNKETLDQLMKMSNDYFSQKYGYNIYKGTKLTNQLIGQAEIDVIGISFDEHQSHLYAIDVAFHEAGLNYGSKDETVARIIKKCLRTAMCVHGYFDVNEGTIIFTSPKINPSVENDLMRCVDDIILVLNKVGLNFKVRIIANDEFNEKILDPVLNVIGNVADTSELFMRSLQMYNLFAGKQSEKIKHRRKTDNERTITTDFETIESKSLQGLEEMKIGVIVRTILKKKLEDGKVGKEEVEQMQTKEYSKHTFDIQYPLLQKAVLTNGKSPARYYSTPIKINGEEYFLCSEWYEVAANNDRPYLMRWLGLHQ